MRSFNLNVVGLKTYILRAILESLLEAIFLNLNAKAQFFIIYCACRISAVMSAFHIVLF